MIFFVVKYGPYHPLLSELMDLPSNILVHASLHENFQTACIIMITRSSMYLLIFFRTLLQDIYKIAKCTSTLLYLKHQNMSLSHDYYSYILASFQSFLLIHTFYFVLQTFAFRWGKKYCLLKFTHKLFSPFLHEYTTQCFTNYSICFFT